MALISDDEAVTRRKTHRKHYGGLQAHRQVDIVATQMQKPRINGVSAEEDVCE